MNYRTGCWINIVKRTRITQRIVKLCEEGNSVAVGPKSGGRCAFYNGDNVLESYLDGEGQELFVTDSIGCGSFAWNDVITGVPCPKPHTIRESLKNLVNMR